MKEMMNILNKMTSLIAYYKGDERNPYDPIISAYQLYYKKYTDKPIIILYEWEEKERKSLVNALPNVLDRMKFNSNSSSTRFPKGAICLTLDTSGDICLYSLDKEGQAWTNPFYFLNKVPEEGTEVEKLEILRKSVFHAISLVDESAKAKINQDQFLNTCK